MNKIPEDMKVGTVHKTNNYGDLAVVEYVNTCLVMVRFTDTGYERYTYATAIRAGRVKDVLHPSVYSVGYFGVGEYTRKQDIKIYGVWKNMLGRCYSEKTQTKHPTYIGCTVCEDWHNFQNFAAWYEDNYPKDGMEYQLDKDIKVKGNRVYSPETCMFATRTENMAAAHAKSYFFRTPKRGRSVFVYNLREFCIKTGLCDIAMYGVARGKRKSHKGWTKA